MKSFTKWDKFGLFMLTDSDRRILRHVQSDPDISVSELAELCKVTQATIVRRLDRMKDTGTIRGRHAEIDWAAQGYTVEVSLRVTLEKTNPRAFDEFLVEARRIPEVIEIQTFLGRVDVRLSVIALDMADYQAVYRSKILTLPHIADIEALMHVAKIKSNPMLPI